MVINIFSLSCSMAFAPYLAECVAAYMRDGAEVSWVVRQGGSGLIIRAGEEVELRHQNRETALARTEARHFAATIELRREAFDISLTSDEVILASAGQSLLLSHPQSELWLEADVVAALLSAAGGSLPEEAEPGPGIPDWLEISTGAGRLLLSDLRNGRWVLLGDDHLAEMKRRLATLESAGRWQGQSVPPTIVMKGIVVHLQSARRLLHSLESYARSGEVFEFEEVTPVYSLRVVKTPQGMEISDGGSRAGMPSRDARKWASIIASELDRLNVVELERGGIRTVFSDGEQGRWILQWGDEVFLPGDLASELSGIEAGPCRPLSNSLYAKRDADFLLLLAPASGGCVALTPEELSGLGAVG